MVKEVSTYIRQGFDMVLSMFASISVNLGIMNLLPIPGLDGGRLLFLAVEGIRRKPLPRDKEGIVNLIGLGLMMLLMVVVMFRDIIRLF
jgi:regulator of sigma E protease